MDIDSAEKLKGTGKKGKQANSTTMNKKELYCHNCKRQNLHGTGDCYLLAKNADKCPKSQGQSKGNNQSKGNDQKTGTKGSTPLNNYKAKRNTSQS